MFIADAKGRVLVIHKHGDAIARSKLLVKLEHALAERGVSEAVESSAAVRSLLERHAAREQAVAAILCASDPTGAAPLIQELAEPTQLGARVVVVLESTRGLADLPKRLRDAFEFIGVDERGEDGAIAAALERVADLDPAPRPVDALASVFRSAIARRSPDGLAALHSSVARVVELDGRELTVLARVGDDGPRPNPLWSRWVSHDRTVGVVEPTGKSKPTRKQ